MRRRPYAVLLWALFILALCTIPGQSIPSTRWTSVDKVIHALLFFVLAWMWMRAWPSRRSWAYCLGGGTLYAAFTEIYQGWLPWERVPDPLDFLANVVGLLVGFVSFVLLDVLRSRARP